VRLGGGFGLFDRLVFLFLFAHWPRILAASPAESLGLHIAQANTIVQAFVKLPSCLSERES